MKTGGRLLYTCIFREIAKVPKVQFLSPKVQFSLLTIWKFQKIFVSLYSQSGYKCNDVFASKMTGQDAESALAALPTAQNNMNLETFNLKIRITMEINNSSSNRRGSPPCLPEQ